MPDGLWTDVVDEKTGEHSLKTHTLRVVYGGCKFSNHDYEEVDNAKRLIACKKCGHERSYILGLEQLKDGKVVYIQPPK